MKCGTCREEVRFGWRDGNPGWWHRGPVDHESDPVWAPEVEEPEEIPPVEVPCRPVTAEDFPARSGIRQIIALVTKQGWELRRLTKSRGPYIGSKGTVLSVSDCVVLAARGPARLDGRIPKAVASWRDGAFDFAYIGTTDAERVNATELKNWIKGKREENPRGGDDRPGRSFPGLDPGGGVLSHSADGDPSE